jgi:hypothetical protein
MVHEFIRELMDGDIGDGLLSYLSREKEGNEEGEGVLSFAGERDTTARRRPPTPCNFKLKISP